MTRVALPLWRNLTSPGAEALIARDPVVVLPLAAVEQHGPHLPVGTDLDILEGLLAAAWSALPADFPGAVLPPQAVGASAEHARFPGTASLPAGTLEDVVYHQGAALASHGVRRLVLVNTHGGNRHVLDAAGLRLRADHGTLVVKASYFRFARPGSVELPDAEWRHGLHGGAVETSMMLHLRPDLVRIEALADARSLGHELERSLERLGPEGEASFSWLAGDLHPSGVTGDATSATAEMGRLLVTHYAEALASVLRDARAFPLERLRR